jgi:hypothetical protein
VVSAIQRYLFTPSLGLAENYKTWSPLAGVSLLADPAKLHTVTKKPYPVIYQLHPGLPIVFTLEL